MIIVIEKLVNKNSFIKKILHGITMRIDAHQHFWIFNPVRDSWIRDDMQMIRRDFSPADLQPILQQHQFDGSIAIQADQSEDESEFLLDHAAANDFIKGVVGWLDLRAENAEERLRYFSRFSKLKGFRHIVQAEPADDFLLEDNFCRGISLLKIFGLTYDILVYPKHLPYVIEFVNRFPFQPFVIDHMGKPDIRDKKLNEWQRYIRIIAEHENVFCKISGFVTEADWKTWKKEDFVPYIDIVVESFGINRIMYGSDWPVCLLAASYEQVIGLVKDYFSSFSEEEQAKFFGANAARFYQLL